MNRLLVSTATLNEASPTLPKEALCHLKVLRPKPGEVFELFDGQGRWRHYAWNGGLRAITPTPQASQPSQASQITLFACVTKGSRWDWTIAKATELGVSRIVPVISARTIVRLPQSERAAKRDRWQRVAEDAARQSDAKWLPRLDAAIDFADALPLVRETACFFGALTSPPSSPLAEAIRRARAAARKSLGPVSTFIGPEGDFTDEELAALTAIATPTSFGPTILRAETAAIFAVSVIAAEFQLDR